jgi:hypothetical protein
MKFGLLALPLIAAGVLSAQGPGPRSLTPPTPAQALQRQLDFLTKFYTLTTTSPNQVSDVQSILSVEQQTCLATPTALQTARESMVAALKTWNPAGKTPAPADVTAYTSLLANQELCRVTAAAGIWAVLTSTQQMKGIGPLLGGPGGRGGGPGFHHGPPPKQ